MKTLRVGLLTPYAWDVPGGVNYHVRDLAENLMARGHHVQVLAPSDDESDLPPYVTSAGGTVPVNYNGSTARVAFGPLVSRRVETWLRDGAHDVVHIHEPIVPSVGLIALRAATAPVVGTFHSSQERSRAMIIANPFLQPGLERISARIAVSEAARRTVVEHLGGDAVVIPNGVEVDRFANASPDPRWQGSAEAPTIGFLGRLDEPRKGLQVLLGAVTAVRRQSPGARFLVAGRGDIDDALRDAGLPRDAVEYLGEISESDKLALFASLDLYVAPQIGGESFGIVLVEAMSGGAGVISSDLVAFRAVLDDGASGRIFRTGDSADLARVLIEAIEQPEETERLRRYARTAVGRFDWGTVASRVLDVYAMVTAAPSDHRGLLERIFRGRR
ncbi:glycosyltransferase family 4 protein [Pseudactinotalea suaedae]|uniref:glycosyltransferase family 4 protein n=1 Tax=Pseudactinotalea suaedae TaxID=1524924 RepID=UPI001F4FF3EE|nr:glycosyltransferase family 4 protein [Pseudactinotalea suaedae]